MRLLYFRCSVHRKPEFQTKTVIYEDDGYRFVRKEAVCPEGIGHIRKIADRCHLARKLYGEHAAEDSLQGEAIITPYYDGIPLGDRLCHAFLKDDAEQIKSLLFWWKKLVTGDQKNICRFEETEPFREIFGTGKKFLGAPAAKISNCDCSSENIMMQGADGYRIIDLEWLFDFPVPIDFLWYRVVKQFQLSHQFRVGKSRLLYCAGISRENTADYEGLESSFQRFISYDAGTGIDYSQMGKSFCDAHVDMRDLGDREIRYIPRLDIPEGSRVCLYAAGAVGVDFYHFLKSNSGIQLVAWTDQRADLYIRQGMDLMPLEQVAKILFDYLLIAVSNASVANEIREELMGRGIPGDKILWEAPLLRE